MGGEEGPRTPDGRLVYPVEFELNVPPRAARRIARLKGRVEMRYAGGKEIVRIPQAVRAEQIRKADLAADIAFSSEEGREVESDRLKALGLVLKVRQAVQLPGALLMGLEGEAEKTYVDEVQIFDADGRPVPSLGRQFGGGEHFHGQMWLFGTPRPPLSMAVVVTAGGESIALPLELKDVPLRNEPAPADDGDADDE